MTVGGRPLAGGGFTVTVVVAEVGPAPFDAVNVNVIVCGVPPAAIVGATKVALGAVSVPPCVNVMLTVVVDHVEVIAPRVGTFGSDTVPPSVTGAPDATVCAAPAPTMSGFAGLIVTVVAAVEVPPVFVDDSRNVNVSAVLVDGITGAVKVAVGAAAVPPCVNVTVGWPAVSTWDQTFVSVCGGLFGSTAVPVSVTAAPDATVWAAPAVTTGGCGGTTVTVVVEIVVAVVALPSTGAPLPTVRTKVSVSDVWPAGIAGAVNRAVAGLTP
jgi:hypothetical protein